jgi:uridine kinase
MPGVRDSVLKDSQGIFTILRNKDTSRQDFVFFADRLSTLLAEKALELLPHRSKTVVTPIGIEAIGQATESEVCRP